MNVQCFHQGDFNSANFMNNADTLFAKLVLGDGCVICWFLGCTIFVFKPSDFQRKQVVLVASFSQQTSCFFAASQTHLIARYPDPNVAEWTQEPWNECLWSSADEVVQTVLTSTRAPVSE